MNMLPNMLELLLEIFFNKIFADRVYRYATKSDRLENILPQYATKLCSGMHKLRDLNVWLIAIIWFQIFQNLQQKNVIAVKLPIQYWRYQK